MSKVTFGLVGRNISYSFSRGYFSEKFRNLSLDNYQYINFDIPSIKEITAVFENKEQNLKGFNVTIPYKQDIQPYLTEIDEVAVAIGAVNTVKLFEDGSSKGYNTDMYGFLNSIKPLLQTHHTKALILGTGGASKAVAYALELLGVDYKFVSRSAKENQLVYEDITKTILTEYTIVINCSPLGTFPNIDHKPAIPYEYITKQHLLYDLIYNPEETTFLRLGKEQGAVVKNGLEMLQLQAEKAWEIWNN